MRKNAISICSYVLIAAGFSSFARWVQNQAAFELESGLMIPGSVWSKVALAVCVVCLGGIVWFVRDLWYKGLYPAQTYSEIIHGDRGVVRRVTRAIAGLMVIGAVVAFLIAGYQLYSSMVRTLCVLAVAAAWAFVKLSEEAFAEKQSSLRQTLLGAIPAVMYMYWLIVSYRTHAAIPSVWSYAVEIFAIAAGLVGTFYFAGYGFDFPRPYWALGGLMTGAYLALVTLLDSRNVGLTLMLVAGAAMQMYYVWMIVTSMSDRWPEEAVEAAGEEQ